MYASYFVVDYDNEASGPFTPEGANLTWHDGVGFIVTLVDRGTTGKLYCGLVSGNLPSNNDVLTQGSTTADANGDGAAIEYPAYARQDLAVANTGAITWTGPALGTSHSFFFDGQTGNVSAGDILTFSPDGQQCEVITVESDTGAAGELSVRFITNLDSYGLPDDNDTFSNGGTGDGVVNGLVHPRAYSPLELHRMLADLNDDEDISGDDDLSRVDPTPSDRSTDEIITLLGNVNIDTTVMKHLYGGSVAQTTGHDLFSGLNVQVTSPNAATRPVLIQNDAIITDYWKNAFMPDSIKGNVRIMVQTKKDGVDIDGRRIKGKLLEFGHSYFTGSTTLGTATTALALFSTVDGNNDTAEGTVAGAPYNTIVVTEGYQTIDYNNGNGPKPYGLSIDYGSANSKQCYERTKYIQRRTTAETLFGRSAIYFDGINLNFAYDGESGGPFTEDEKVFWGTVITYTGQTVSFTVGEVVTFSGGSHGRLLYQKDDGGTGTCVFDMGGNAAPATSETMTGEDSGGNGTVGTVGSNTVAGSGTLIALKDDGATGYLYISRLTGVLPINNSEIYGGTSNATCLVNGTVSTRTINNQFIGVYTGTNFQTNFGLGIDETDAIVGDKFPDLLGGTQEPPNNQQGQVTGLKHWDTATVYPWDGTSYDVNGDAEPNFDEMLLSVALTGGVSTVVNVGTGNIPKNTPQSGNLRIERNSDGNMDLVPYASHDGDDEFTLVGTAPSDASIGNDVMRAFIDLEMAADGTASYTAVKDPAISTQVAITVKNGYSADRNGPIKVFKSTSTFGATGFSVGAVRTSDA